MNLNSNAPVYFTYVTKWHLLCATDMNVLNSPLLDCVAHIVFCDIANIDVKGVCTVIIDLPVV